MRPLPSSSKQAPAEAKKRYLESKKATDRYLDPHEKLLQMNREIELVRDQAATRLETELQKSVWKRLTDPLVKHKHSLYNIMAMTIAYVLAHNLYVVAKKEKECRAELMRCQEENAKLHQAIKSLLDESTLRDFGSACAMEIKKQNEARATHFWGWSLGRSTSGDATDNSNLRDSLVSALREFLSVRVKEVHAVEKEDDSTLSLEEIMEENQKNMEAINTNPELLLQDAIQQSASKQENGESPRNVFSL